MPPDATSLRAELQPRHAVPTGSHSSLTLPERLASSSRSGGIAGNERLTAATAAVLLVLLAVEGVTVVFMGPLLPVHLFVGMLLVPPVLLKIGTTGYRFVRYYSGTLSYVAKGPPAMILRVLGPAVVLTSLALFATGVALLIVGPHPDLLILAHKASFFAWFAAMAIHVLGHILEVPRAAAADWRSQRRERDTLPGSGARRGALAISLVTGLVLALSTIALFGPWIHHPHGG